jgi:FkbM family methyltransferase
LGGRDDVWRIRPDLLDKNSVIYSFGVGEDLNFETAVIDQFGATVHAFDPTPRSLEWTLSQCFVPELIFHDLGIGGADGKETFYPPLRSDHVSYSTCVRPTVAGEAVSCEVRRLATIMDQLGHDHLDILKMDIEGSEYDVLSDMLISQTPVRQLLVEFHHRWKEIGPGKTERAVHALSEAGYRIFHVSSTGMEYCFSRE